MKRKPPVVMGLVNEDVMGKWFDKAQEMVDLKLGVDDDGDPRVELAVCDRSRYERNHFLNVPYTHKAAKNKELEAHQAAFEIELINLAMATEAVTRRIRIVNHMKEKL